VIADLTKKHDKISDRVYENVIILFKLNVLRTFLFSESLAIEQRAVKFLQHDMNNHIKNLENMNSNNNSA